MEVVRLSQKKTKREEYLEMIKKRAEKSPDISQIIEETVRQKVELSKDRPKNKGKEQKK